MVESQDHASHASHDGRDGRTVDKDLPAIRACLFDMDGLLIDSEDKYTLATNSMLQKFGRPNLPWKIKAQLQGRPGPQAGKILHDWAQLPISQQEFQTGVSEYQRQLFPHCQPLPGVVTLLNTLSAQTDPPVYIALATSSHTANYHLKTDHMQDLFALFPAENRITGDDPRIKPGRGKPAPDIYLLALDTINERLRKSGVEAKDLVTPAQCLVFEDSVPGVEAGRRAGMQTVWCPHPELLKEFAGREDQVLAGLMGEYKEDDHVADATPQAGSGNDKVKSTSGPGQVGDGWGRLFISLEDFPYADYKIGVSSKDAASV